VPVELGASLSRVSQSTLTPRSQAELSDRGIIRSQVKPMPAERPNYLDRITQDPKVIVGEPVVRGTRVPVERVLQHSTENPDTNDVFETFPRLTMDDVNACLAYAQDVVEQKGRRAARRELPAQEQTHADLLWSRNPLMRCASVKANDTPPQLDAG
jgi:uncharacterized protein (DUF433 family)